MYAGSVPFIGAAGHVCLPKGLLRADRLCGRELAGEAFVLTLQW
jgi:hypothetical protein